MSISESKLDQILENQRIAAQEQQKIEKQLRYIYKMLNTFQHFFFPFQKTKLNQLTNKDFAQFDNFKQHNKLIDLDGYSAPNPMIFKTIHRNITLTVDPVFSFADGERGHELLSVHDDKYAAVRFGMVDAKKTGISFKIRFGEELEMFLAKARYALDQALYSGQQKGKQSDESFPGAYKTFQIGPAHGESAATLLFDNRVDDLREQRKYFVQNLEQYPKNAEWIRIIDTSCKLYKAGKLSKDNAKNGEIEIYNRSLRLNPHKRHLRHKEKYYISRQTITFHIGEPYPFKFQAYEAFSGGVKKGNLMVPTGERIDKKTVCVNLTEAEFRDLIQRISFMNQTIFMFRTLQTFYPAIMLKNEEIQKRQSSHKKAELNEKR